MTARDVALKSPKLSTLFAWKMSGLNWKLFASEGGSCHTHLTIVLEHQDMGPNLMTVFNIVQNWFLVKGEDQKNPLSWRFSGDLVFSGAAIV